MDDLEDDAGLPVQKGTTLSSTHALYVLDELLGEGGFGAVWRVHLAVDETRKYAMKIEKKLDKRKHSKLKMEAGCPSTRLISCSLQIAILKLVLNERKKENRHFTPIVDRGKKANFYFLVMQLVGRSLEDLLIDLNLNCFSLATALGIGIQAMEALEDLHKYGFVHRDLKPANYACGLGDKTHVIYLLDFGIARKFVADENNMKTPRQSVNFKGTVRYASLSCHRHKEMGPKDDAESWYYMLIELMHESGLPWQRLNDRAQVMRAKEEVRKKPRSWMPAFVCQEELLAVLKYIDSLLFIDRLDYQFFYKTLRLCAELDAVRIDAPFDWESTNAPVPQPQAVPEASILDGSSSLKRKVPVSPRASSKIKQ